MQRAWTSMGVGVVLAVLLGGASPAVAAAGDHQMELKAREAFAAGRYDEALELFAKLYADTLHPVYLRNIGRCHQKQREPQKAIDAFHDYLAKSKKVTPDERKEIDGYIAEMEALRDEQAREQAQKPPPPAVTPPPPLTAPPPAPRPAQPEASLVAAPGPAPATESSPIYTRWWFWTAIAVVAAGGVATALVLSSGTSRPDCTAQVCK